MVPPSDPVLRATRVLAGVLGLVSAGVLVIAVLALVSAGTSSKEDLADLALFGGLVFAVLGLIELSLAVATARAKRSRRAFLAAIPTALVGLPGIGVLGLFWRDAGPMRLLTDLLWLVPIALLGCALAGLVRSRGA